MRTLQDRLRLLLLLTETVMNRLCNMIFLHANGYDEHTFVPWLGRWVYRRTVDFNAICLQ